MDTNKQSITCDIKSFSKGDVVVKINNKKHTGVNPGNTVTKFVVFYMGTERLKNTIFDWLYNTLKLKWLYNSFSNTSVYLNCLKKLILNNMLTNYFFS